MNKEYIEREAVIEKCNKLLDNANSCPDQSVLSGIQLVRDLILINKETRVQTADVEPVRHAHWTGKLTSDEAFAEGVPATATEEEREEYQKWKDHRTHCSNCKGGFDDRRISDWKYCPYCGACMGGGSKNA